MMWGQGRTSVAMLTALLVSGWSCPIVTGAAGATRQGPVRLVDLLPGSSALYLNLDVGQMVADFDKLDLVKLYQDEEVFQFLEPAVAFLKQGGLRQAAAVRFMLNAYGFPQVIRGNLTLALTGLGAIDGHGRIAWFDGDVAFSKEMAEQLTERTEHIIPDLVLRIETAGREAFESTLARLFELPPTEFATADLLRDGFRYQGTSFELPDTPLGALTIYHGFVGQDFLAVLREERLLEIAAGFREGEASGVALSADPAFSAWRQSSVRGGEVLEIYAGLGHALSALSPFWTTGLEVFRSAGFAGLDDLEGVGYTLAVEQGRLRESLAAVLPEKRRGLLTLLDALLPSGTLVRQVPGEAAAALALDLDPAVLFDRWLQLLHGVAPEDYEALLRELSAFQEELGLEFREEVLAALGTRAVFHATMPVSGWLPELSGSVLVRDRELAGLAMDRLREALEREAGNDLQVREISIGAQDGALYVTLKGVPVTPTILLAADRFYFASSPNALKRALKSESDQAGRGGPSRDLERCLVSCVGQRQAEVALLLYLDLARGVEYGLGMSEMFLPAILAQAPFELDAGRMPLPETVAEYLSGALLTVRVSERTLAVDLSAPAVGVLLPLAVSSTFLLGLW